MSRKCPSCGTSFPDEVFFCGNDGTITIQEQDPADPDPRLGSTLGDYIVVARVADGAMGRVYEARHHETKQRVAIKVLHADVAKDPIAVERFKREYDAARELQHPHIVSVVDFGQTRDGSCFMTMEYLEGEELGAWLRREGPLSFERIVRVVAQAADALDHAHSFGFVHRDLKPDNVFLCRSPDGDDVRILDFGSVKLQMETGPKLTAFGTTLGSPYYMSPEQAMGKQDVDGRTDVFALGAILFEMSTGKIAFDGSTIAEILMKVVNESPPQASQLAPGVPAALDDVVDKACRKDKTRRYGTPTELANATIRAFGLDGDAKQWGHTPSASIQEALAGATPPPPKALGVDSLPPAAPVGGPAAQAPLGAPPAPRGPRMPDALDTYPTGPAPAHAGGSSANPSLLLFVGLAVLGVLALGGALVAFLLT